MVGLLVLDDLFLFPVLLVLFLSCFLFHSSLLSCSMLLDIYSFSILNSSEVCTIFLCRGSKCFTEAGTSNTCTLRPRPGHVSIISSVMLVQMQSGVEEIRGKTPCLKPSVEKANNTSCHRYGVVPHRPFLSIRAID